MTNPFASPQSKEFASGTSLWARLLLAGSKRRGLFFGGVAIGLTLISFVLLAVTGILITVTDNPTDDPAGERSFALECFLGLLLWLGVGMSFAAASAAIYGASKELRRRDNTLAAGIAFLGVVMSVPWCGWLLRGLVMGLLVSVPPTPS